MKHIKKILVDKELSLPSDDIIFHRAVVDHIGKKNHRISGEFEVKQVQKNIESKIKFYVIDDTKTIPFLADGISKYNHAFFSKKNCLVVRESINDKFNVSISQNGVLYFVCSNRYLLTVQKPVVIKIFEEWDMDDTSTEIVTTEPPRIESIKQKIETMINDSTDSLWIISPYVDMSLINKIIKKRDEGISVRIILTADPELKGLIKKGREQIQKNFPNDHKLIKNVHSRLIIVDSQKVLISSADLTQDSLQIQHNFGIVINDDNVTREAIQFFNNLWSNE